MASNNVEVLDPAAPVEKNTNTASGCEVDRRHFLALGVVGAAAGTALMVSSKAEAQQPTPGGFAQVDVLNLMLNIKYLKATLYSYITQGADLPASSYVTLGTGAIYNQPKVTFAAAGNVSAQQITDIFNEMYYDELNQLIALRALQGVAASNRPTMNLLGTGPSGAAPSSATTTMTTTQAIALARLLEDLSASAFAIASVYLTGTNLAYAAQVLASDGSHAGLMRLLAIQTGAPYQGTQYSSTTTSNTAQTATTFTGNTTAGTNTIYALLPTTVLPVVGQVFTGNGIAPGAGAIVTDVSAPANKALTAIANKNTTLTHVSSVTGLVAGMPITGTFIPANTVITAVGTDTLTISAATTSASTVSPTGIVVNGSPVITGVNSVSGLIAGQAITGTFVPAGTTIVSFTSSPLSITMSANASASSVATFTGTLTSGSPTINNISSNSGLSIGQPVLGTGIPAGSTIVSIGASSLDMSANATANSPATTTSFTGIAISASTTISAVSSTSGLAVGQLIAGPGMPVGATVKTIGSNTVTISAAATSSAAVVNPTGLSTTGSAILTSVSSVAGITIGLGITGTGIPSGTTVTALGTDTITMSKTSTATVSPVTVACPTSATFFAGGTAITTPITEAFSSPATEAITVGITAVTVAQPIAVSGFNTYYIVVADPQDVQPGDPGSATTSASGPSAITGISPTMYQGFFNTAGAGTAGATNTPAGFAFARSFQQILAVLYGYNSSNSVITTQNYQGGFFPFGVSGQINSAI